ncbi:MAG: hypothetical protein K0S39_1607 [Paenibacillus sp.]|jgi:hypothetical protein|nr:hypothetical protein [Paenibacillus sp.]
MKRLPWMTVLSGLVVGAGIWTPFLIQKEPALAMSEAVPAEAAIVARAPVPAAYAAVSVPEAGGSLPSPEKTKPFTFRLATINGVSLADDIKTVYEMKGTPLSVKQDEIMKSMKTYTFEDCVIGMSDGAIQFVKVPAAAGQIEIDGQILPLKLEELKSKLGQPFFVAEDGIVYKAGYHALKIFLDAETGELASVHFFSAVGQ